MGNDVDWKEAVREPVGTIPGWIRPLAVFIIAVGAIAFSLALIELLTTMFTGDLDLSLYPSDDRPSSLPVLCYTNRLALASAIFSGTLTPFFIIGGVLLYLHRESGRRILVVGFAIRTVWYAAWLFFWVNQIARFGDQPEILPPTLAWSGLAAILCSGGIGVIFLGVLAAPSTKALFVWSARGSFFDSGP